MEWRFCIPKWVLLPSRAGRKVAALLLFVAALLVTVVSSHGQSLAAANARFRWVNGAQASGNIPDVATDTNGNSYVIWQFNSTNATVAGTTLTNAGGYDNFLVKYDSQGQPLWFRQFTGDHSDFGLAVAVDSTGAVYVVGDYYSDVLTVGNLSITNSQAPSDGYIFFTKLDTNGAPVWLRSFGTGGTNTAYHIAVDSNNNLLVGGSFRATNLIFDSVTLTNGGDTDIFFAKFDPDGRTLWAKRAGGSKADTCYRIVVDAQNNSYFTGYFQGTATFGTVSVTSAGSFDTYVAKYDGSGNAVWVVGGGGTGTDEGFGIAQDGAGNSYVTGYYSSTTATFGGQTINSAGGNDIFTLKISPTGTVVWARTAGGAGDDKGRAITVDSQGNIYVAAYFSGTATFGTITLTSAGGADTCIIKYDPSGNVQWAIPFGGLSDDLANAAHMDSGNHLYLAGTCSSNVTFGGINFTNSYSGGPFLTRLDFLPPPISIVRTNGNPAIQWSTNFVTPVVAQQSTNLANWFDLTNPPILTNGYYTITNLPLNRASFYRLRNLN